MERLKIVQLKLGLGPELRQLPQNIIVRMPLTTLLESIAVTLYQ